MHGFGPFNEDVTTFWEILRLTNSEMTFETSYQGKQYRVEFQEFE
jgi:hypothetical protein